MGLSEYLDALTSQIRCTKARKLVADELASHIEDQKESLVAAGMSESEAMEESIRQMGDPVAVGVELDRIHRPALDWKFLIFIIFLSLAGLFIQYQIAGGPAENSSLFFRHCAYTLLGFFIMTTIYFMDFTAVSRYSLLFWGILTAYFLYVGLFSMVIAGSRSYTQLTFYLYVPVFAGILYRFRQEGTRGLLRCLILFTVTMALGIQSTGTFNVPLFFALIFLVMTTFAVKRGWFPVPQRRTLILLWSVFFLLPSAWILAKGLSPYQYERLINSLSLLLGNDERSCCYLTAHAFELLSSSPLWGSSGCSAAEFFPSVPMDYIFIFIVSRYGIGVGAAATAVLLAAAFRGIRLSLKLSNELGKMISLGCSCVFIAEIIHYILTNCGLLIIAQTYMPFFSYGLRASVLTYSFCGLLLSIYRYKDVVGEIRQFPLVRFPFRKFQKEEGLPK